MKEEVECVSFNFWQNTIRLNSNISKSQWEPWFLCSPADERGCWGDRQASSSSRQRRRRSQPRWRRGDNNTLAASHWSTQITWLASLGSDWRIVTQLTVLIFVLQCWCVFFCNTRWQIVFWGCVSQPIRNLWQKNRPIGGRNSDGASGDFSG